MFIIDYGSDRGWPPVPYTVLKSPELTAQKIVIHVPRFREIAVPIAVPHAVTYTMLLMA